MLPSTHDRAARTSHFERRRPFFWMALAFCAGIVLDELIAPSLPQLGGGGVAAAAAVLLLWAFKREFVSGRGALITACVLAACAGALNHGFGSRVPPPNDISRKTSTLSSFVFVEGTIIECRRARADDTRAEWTLSVSRFGVDANVLAAASGRVVLKAPPESDGLAEGDRLLCCARLEAPPDLRLPGGFDLASFLAQQGVRRVGEVLPGSVQPLGRSHWRIDLLLRRWSSHLSQRIEELVPENQTDRAALLNALLFGRRERVSFEDREAFAIAGTAHLLAISGLQIQFFAWGLFFVAALCGLRRRQCAGLVIVVCCLYCALAGADAPILRATVMILFYLGAMLLWREPDVLSILGASAVAILAFAPEQLFSPGFQLSFAAVLTLVTILPVLDAAIDGWWLGPHASIVIAAPRPAWMLPWRERAVVWLRQSVLITAAATLGTAPIIAWHMGRVSLFSLVINLVAVPLGSLCMIAGLAALLFSFTPLVSTLAATLALMLVALLQWLNTIAAHAPGAAIDVPSPPVIALAVYAAALALLWRMRPGGVRPAQAALVCSLCGVLLFSGWMFRASPESPTVTILDLPRGRSALVEAPEGGAALIDAGGEGDG
ncbi:MAG TPA: ComEC/Rec2 family competence protein, partial [Planctomycetota bacterium]|nr:ComEC/Rec2 family competence protein [Planctomycetota bacterium]